MHRSAIKKGALRDRIPRMLPNPTQHDTSLDYFKSLVERIGQTYDWIAEHSGISRRRLQYLNAGTRLVAGVYKPVILSYPEQFILETLAEVGDVFNKT